MKINNSNQGYFEYTDSSQGDKDALFVRGKQWVYKTYKSGDAVIQMDDKDAGLIECKGRTKVFRAKVGGFWHDVGGFEYKMSLRFKDGKYKCTIYDLTFVKAGDLWINEGADFSEEYPHNWNKAAYKKSPEWWNDMRAAARDEWLMIVSSLADAMRIKKADDW